MAANAIAEELPRTDDPTPNRESTTTRNRTGRRNFRNAGSNNRKIGDFSGEKKDIEAVLNPVTEQVDKVVTFERFQVKLKNYVFKSVENGEYLFLCTSKMENI